MSNALSLTKFERNASNPTLPALTVTGLFELATYTVATLPAAAAGNTGAVAYCSNGNAGAACVVVSNGTAWKVVALGATAAAA